MIDDVQLNFDPGSLLVLNVILGLVMFGVALELTPQSFRNIVKDPRGTAVGLSSQLLVLPALTFGLVWLLEPQPSVALGMMLVAACPGGNMSNFFTHLSRGNTSLSISMTAVVTAGAFLFTPGNLSFWGGLNPRTAQLLTTVSIDPLKMAVIVGLVLLLPITLGMGVRAKKPDLARKLVKPFKIGSIVVFVLFVVIALGNNFGAFLEHIDKVFGLVLVHNAVALAAGFGMATLFKLPQKDRRSLTIETGIQNSGLGLVLIFTFFDGLGGMAIIAAWWGVWHLISGLAISAFWGRKA